MKIAFFGSSLVSAYWNGAATYYRGLIAALAARGHRIVFYEPDAFGRQEHRDMDPPDWAEVAVYEATEDAAARCLDAAKDADLVVKASGVGVLDAFLEAGVADLRAPGRLAVFWDVDAPATLDSLSRKPDDPLHGLIPRFDAVFTYGGGEPVAAAYRTLGARDCIPIYNALDPDTHHPVAPRSDFAADLTFVGNRLPDRETRVEEFFLRPAASRPSSRFLIGGSGWDDKPMPGNVTRLGHVYTRDHNALNCSARAVLNVTRDSMVAFGFSPATRVFEVAGAGACLVSDAWEGIERFLEPEAEILLARAAEDVAAHLDALTEERAAAIGAAARARLLAHHTYAHRAAEVERVLDAAPLGHRTAKEAAE